VKFSTKIETLSNKKKLLLMAGALIDDKQVFI